MRTQNFFHAERRTLPLVFCATTRRWPRLLMLLAAFWVILLSAGMARAQVSGYTFATSTGATLAPTTGATQLIGSSVDDTPSALINIGFTFVFGGAATQLFRSRPTAF